MIHTIKIKDIKKEDIPYIKRLCEEYNCEFLKEWQSKYNRYIIYDYEPPCSGGFEINAYVKNEDCNKAQFVEYLYNKRKEKINKLNEILNTEVKV